MYPRIIKLPAQTSVFLLGPRGTGKSTWLQGISKNLLTINLLEAQNYQQLLIRPQFLEAMIGNNKIVAIDEIQRLPDLLHEVHRLIESKKIQFILTGSSARKLQRTGTNLLGGRARILEMHPLISIELGKDFSFKKSVKYGHLPTSYTSDDPAGYLKGYLSLYIQQEVKEEAAVRNLAAFTRFLESASFSQAQILNVASVGKDSGVDRKTAENYFQVLEDLLIAARLPVFSRRAKRKLVTHSKFFYFDTGVFRYLRPRGPLDSEDEMDGACLETLVFQELRALNSYLNWEYQIHFWKSHSKHEVDFVLYGPKGFHAIEVKRSHRFDERELIGLKEFKKDYKESRCTFYYLGNQKLHIDGIEILPLQDHFQNFEERYSK
jgi:predicted AAA+ superfamily ATPase